MYERWRERFHGLRVALEKQGVDVVNCTPNSSLTAFRRLPLDRALQLCDVVPHG